MNVEQENKINFNQNNVQEESELNIRDYINIVLRYKWLIISIFLVVLVIARIQVSKMPRIYMASAKILLEDTSNAKFILGAEAGGFNSSQSSLNNNIEILKSRPVMKLTLDLLQKEEDYDSFPLSKSEYPIGVLQKNIEVESKRETDILTISFESTSPRESQAVADATSKALMEQNTSYARLEFRNTKEFIADQLEEAERRLRMSEEDLRIFKIENGISLLTEETQNLIERASELEAMLSSAEIDLQVSKNQLEYLNQELSLQDTLLLDIDVVLSSPLLDKLRNEIVENQTRYVRLLTKQEYTESHPELVSLRKKIDNAKEQLSNEIQDITQDQTTSQDPLAFRSSLITDISATKTDVLILESKVKSLKNAVDVYNSKLSVLPDTEIQLTRLERTNSINEQTYKMLVSKFEDAKIAEKSKIGNVRILEKAKVPEYPIKPNVKRTMMIFALVGLGIGFGLALLLNSLDSKIRTYDDVNKHVKLPIFGTIPHIYINDNDIDMIEAELIDANDEEKERLEALANQIEKRLITNYAPKSSTSESFRILRTNVIAKKKPGKALSMIVTSSGPQEGKSTIISNLATTIGQLGDRVILIDLDLRRPMVHNLFHLEKEGGISDFIVDNPEDFSKYIKKSYVDNLDILTSGIIPPNPSELLASKNMNTLLDLLEEKYDYIVIDAPPSIAVTDSMVLATKVDIMMLVVRVGKADKEVIRRTKEMLNNINVQIGGAIVNGVKPHKYYSNYEYNYNYHYYYASYSDEEESKS